MRKHYCEECNEPISYRRVQANPKARLCIGCQEEAEHNGDFQLHKIDVQMKTHCGEMESLESTMYRGPT